jgi:hypothetical protein
MNWDAIGSIGEALGAVGVVVSLIYLGTQIRQNTAAIRGGTAQQVTNRAGEIAQSIALNPSMTEIHYRGLRHPDSLSKEETLQFAGLMLAVFRAYENAAYQFRRGFLDPGEWSGLYNNLSSTVEQPGFIVWWTRAGRRGFSPEFQSLVDEITQRDGNSVAESTG